MGKLRHRGQDHTGGDGAWTLAGLSVRGCGLQNAFLFSILMCFLSVSATVQERGGRVPVPGPAGSPAAELPGQAAHRQGDRAGEDEEDGGFAAGAKPGPGRDGCGFGGDGGSVDGDKVLSPGVGTQWLLLCKWKSRIKPHPEAQRLAAHLPAGSTAALGHQPEGLMFVQEFGKEMLTVN